MAKFEVRVEVIYEIEAETEHEAIGQAIDNAQGCDVAGTHLMDVEEVD